MAATLTFLGAAGNVTGSRYLLDTGESKVLVDCGLYQERDLRTRNWEPFPVPPREIDAVLLTHAHLDHSGLLPKLCREGFRGAVHSTAATAEMARIVLEDSARLQEEDAKKKKKRHEREGRQGPFPEEALYTVEDVERCVKLWRPTEYGRAVSVARDLEATFENVGHVFGASFIRVTVGRGSERRTVVFSGDVGRRHMPILEDPSPIGQADYLLTESTYGDRTHGSDEKAVDELARVVTQTVEAGGNLIIPAFAIERSQDLLYHLNSLVLADRIPHLATFLDSPMAIRVGEVFERHRNLYDREMSSLVAGGQSPFDLPELRLVRTSADSKAINHIRGTVVVMAGSGMCTGGRIKHHLAHNVSRRESTILFVGYQAAGTLGRQLVDGAREVRILGQSYPVKARIERIDGFSAHADRDELVAWLSTASPAPRHVFVVHGEPEASSSLVGLIGERFGWAATAPAYLDRVVLGVIMAQLSPVADTTHTYVDGADGVRELLDWLVPADRVAMDIEADGLFHYYEKVCLAQLTVRGRNFIIDPLAGADLAALWAALADKTLLFHSADYDLRMLRNSVGFRPRAGLVDTMVAAQLLGREKLGLATLVEEFAGQPFSKTGQKSDWSRRPLTPAQLLYAVDDTRYLEPLCEILVAELDRLGRRAWFVESCAAAVDVTETDRETESPENWRVKGVWDLAPHQAAIMRELWLWREDEARRADLPPFKVIGNETLVALAIWAQAHPRAPLASGPRLPRHFVGRRLEMLREIVEQAVALDPSRWPEPRLRRNEQRSDPGPAFEKLRHEVARLAHSLNLPASVIAPRLAMEEISRRRPTDVPGIRAAGHLLQWQAELIAPLVAKALGGA